MNAVKSLVLFECEVNPYSVLPLAEYVIDECKWLRSAVFEDRRKRMGFRAAAVDSC